MSGSITDRERLKELEMARYTSNDAFTDATTTVRKVHRRYVSIHVPAGLANTSYDYGVLRLDRDAKIIDVRYADQNAVANSNTNFVTFALTANDDAGGSQTTVASGATTSTDLGSLAATQSKALAVVATAALVTANKALHFKATQTASGVAFGPGYVFVQWEEL